MTELCFKTEKVDMVAEKITILSNSLSSDSSHINKNETKTVEVANNDLIFVTINNDEYWFTKQEVYLSIGIFIFSLVVIFILFAKFINKRNMIKNNLEQKNNSDDDVL